MKNVGDKAIAAMTLPITTVGTDANLLANTEAPNIVAAERS